MPSIMVLLENYTPPILIEYVFLTSLKATIKAKEAALKAEKGLNWRKTEPKRGWSGKKNVLCRKILGNSDKYW